MGLPERFLDILRLKEAIGYLQSRIPQEEQQKGHQKDKPKTIWL